MPDYTRTTAVDKVLSELTGPTRLGVVVDRILELWPSRAKDPRPGIRQEIRYHSGKDVLFPEPGTVAPTWSVLQGVRVRALVRPEDAPRGHLLSSVLHPFIPQVLEVLEALQFQDEEGRSLPTRLLTVGAQLETPFGPFETEAPAFDLAGWFGTQEVQAGDSVLFTLLDRRYGRLALEHEPAAQREEELIARQNRELADIIYELVLNHSMRDAPVTEVVLNAYARLSEPCGYPGDHWTRVVQEDHRLKLGFLDSIELDVVQDYFELGEEFDPSRPVSLSVEQERLARQREEKVYRFKAAVTYRKGLWRRLEILGSQTLGDLDDMMRDAFDHDWSDHLSEFSLYMGGRRRPAGLGHIEPWGGGEGRHPLISHLGLEVKDRLKYVYDFGDWIEHQLTLEAIDEPEADAEYPRQVGQNRPRYRYCEACKEKGRKTVATWICLECSNEQQRSVLVCEECLDAHHEDHYADELTY